MKVLWIEETQGTLCEQTSHDFEAIFFYLQLENLLFTSQGWLVESVELLSHVFSAQYIVTWDPFAAGCRYRAGSEEHRKGWLQLLRAALHRC